MMPLMQGNTDYAKSTNIRRLMDEDRPQDQAVAIAMETARRTKRTSGGATDNPHEATRRAVAEELSTTFMAGQRPNSAHLTGLFYKHSPALQEARARTEAAIKAHGEVAGISPEASLSPRALELERVRDETKKKETRLLHEVRKHASPPKLGFAEGGSLSLPKLNVKPALARPRLHTGPIHSSVAGRTDHLPMHVPNKAYVLPADIVSGFGQGNTMAGFKIAQRLPRLFATQFYGTGKAGAGEPYKGSFYGAGKAGEGSPYGATGTIPYGGTSPPKAAGGNRTDSGLRDDAGVPIVAAGGEHVYHPKDVALIGGGDVDRGHDILDAFVVQYRKHLTDTLKNLPGPKRD